MPDYLVIEPAELRRIAEQHKLAAEGIRKWGEIPHAWLDEFPNTYGTIAAPMHAALVDYYTRRHDKAERAAVNHEQARDQLLAAARALEEGDQTGAHQINQSGGNSPVVPAGRPIPGAPTGLVAPVHAGPDTPTTGMHPDQPSNTTPETPGLSGTTRHPDQAPLAPAAPAPQTDGILPTGVTGAIGMLPTSVGVPEYSAADMPATTGGDSSGATGTAGHSSTVGGTPALATDAYPIPVAPVEAGAAARVPKSLAVGPFAAAVHPTQDRRALPSLVVGERVEDDLVLARTLLAATLAAVRDSARGMDWAVAVGRASSGPIVLLTSTEGRGWLPPGLFLPMEVTLPWRWDFTLRTTGQEAIAALEGTADPSRMLAEFGYLMSRRKNVWISALVSSAAIPDGVRAAMGGDTAIAEWVSPAESAVDFTAPGPGLVDRLALAGSDELLRQAATVPETEIRAKCLELARAADTQVRAAVSSVGGATVTHRARRRQILDALHAGQPVPVSWWDQMRAADDITASALWSRRVDVSSVPVGGVRPGVSTEALRGMVFERRADELLLLLAAGAPDRQTLRDALYTYGQIAEHPLLPEAARVVAAQKAGVGTATPDVGLAHGVGTGVHGVRSVTVGSSRLGGGPPAIAELLNGPAGSEGTGEQRRG
ncbi:type VII secretion target [Nocardia sp. NPDC050630]|uniref:type VII secretion target n=1 Tax=Nocardia sp. NPDC050630 TaxID=3364321 RepID=UPI0037B5502C